MKIPMKRGLFLISLLLLAASCQKDSYNRFCTKYKVYFSCETDISPYNQVLTPGRFLSVKKNNGLLILTDCDGETRKEPMSDNNNRMFMLGLGGLIIGTPVFDNDIRAYDLACPECDESKTTLKVSFKGSATCSKCGGQWDLNTDGTCINTDGKERRPLYRYPTSYINGVFKVSN